MIASNRLDGAGMCVRLYRRTAPDLMPDACRPDWYPMSPARRSSAWQSTCFGSRGSQVRILSPRPNSIEHHRALRMGFFDSLRSLFYSDRSPVPAFYIAGNRVRILKESIESIASVTDHGQAVIHDNERNFPSMLEYLQ